MASVNTWHAGHQGPPRYLRTNVRATVNLQLPKEALTCLGSV